MPSRYLMSIRRVERLPGFTPKIRLLTPLVAKAVLRIIRALSGGSDAATVYNQAK